MNWIKICHATPTKSEVRTIARSLKVSRSHVFGALVTVWIWADQELTPGSNTISGDLDLIDEVGDLPGLAEAMIKVNWLTQVEGGFAFPNIERHLSETAKARALGAARVAKHRIKTPEEKPNRPLPEPCNGQALHPVTVERYKKPKPVTVQRYQRREEEEKNREEIREEKSGSAPPTAETDKPILRFPIQGANGIDAKRDYWHLSRDQVERFRELFPSVDVLAECRKALAWIEADPKRRKTAGGYPRYLTGWLNRTAETKAGPGQVAQAVGPNGKPLNEIERLSMEMFGEVF